MSKKGILERFRDSRDALGVGALTSTMSSMLDGIFGGGMKESINASNEESSRIIGETPLFGGDSTRESVKRGFNSVSESFRNYGRSLKENYEKLNR